MITDDAESILYQTLKHLGDSMESANKSTEFINIYTYVITNGRFYKPQSLPKRYKIGVPGYCFMNAQKIARRSKLVKYVEGFAFSGGIRIPYPIHHAWCVTQEGDVVDPTWVKPGGVAYYGVEFDMKLVVEQLRGNKCASVLDNYEKGYPVLRRV